MSGTDRLNKPSPQPLCPPGLCRRLLTSTWTSSAIVLLIIGATLAWSAHDEYEQTLEQEFRFLEAHARIADGQLSGLLRNIKQLLGRIAEERPALAAAKLGAYEAILVERKLDIPEIRTLAVINAGGRVEITANPSLVGFDSSRRDYFTAHRDRKLEPNFHIARPFKSSFGDYSVTFSVAIRDAQQRFLGVAVSGVNYKFFDSVITPIKPEGGSSVVAISNQQGDIIYRLPEPEKYVGASIAGGAAFQEFMRSGRQMTRSIRVANLDGVERIYVHRAIGNTALNITMARPLDEVLAPWRRNLVVRALIFAFAAAVILSLAGIAHRRQRERRQMGAIRRNEEVSRRMVSIQEEERRRLAAELHDRTSPNLSAIGFNLRNLADALPPQTSGGSAHLLEDTSALLADTIASIRAISFDFRPPVLDYAGLWPALEGYAHQFSRRTGIAVHAEKRAIGARLAPEIETTLFRIAQEALTNCAKHSQAKTIRIALAKRGDTVELAITDDGVGFDPAALPATGKVLGHGLGTMRRRAEFIGGKFTLESSPGKGSRIAVEIPHSPAPLNASLPGTPTGN